ncbi:MAG: hypothetical protein JJU40_08525 [Rhodobacteraceae bacterium]|nr:hypothetical protein [Paracoccaceae bacterium]
MRAAGPHPDRLAEGASYLMRAAGRGRRARHATAGRAAAAALAGALALSGCGLPLMMDMETAMRVCRDEARSAMGPRVNLDLATGTGGPRVGGAVEISTDWLFGRDPERIYTDCVVRRTGELPTRPLRG